MMKAIHHDEILFLTNNGEDVYGKFSFKRPKLELIVHPLLKMENHGKFG
jgi:hypothetical protein